MTTFQLKLLAAILMVCDHVGYAFFPDGSDLNSLLRFIGRFSFPLFAWLVGQGEKYTKNFNVYLVRLLGMALVSQPIYSRFIQPRDGLNILVTLALGLLAIRLDKITNLKFVFAWAFALVAEFLNVSYGGYGVLLIVLLSHLNLSTLNHDNLTWWISWSLLNLTFPLLLGFHPSQMIAILAPFLLVTWNGKQGDKAKWFYLFYPLHFVLILLLQQVYS